MNVKELWSYIDATRALNRAQERLTEYENIIYFPRSARASGMPLERCNDSPDRMAIIADNHEKLIKARDEQQFKAAEALSLLYAFEETLTGDEMDVFSLRYKKGASVSEIEKVLHRSESTLKRINNRIKEKFRKFKS